MMKSAAFAFAAILATTSSAWSATELNRDDLIVSVQRVSHDPMKISGLIGSFIAIDLRPSSKKPYYRALGDQDGSVFLCQAGFEDFAGGPKGHAGEV